MKTTFPTSPGEIADYYRDADRPARQYVPGRSQLGRAIHFDEQQARYGWETELFLKHTYGSIRGDSLDLVGRADLVLRAPDVTRIVEIKTVALTSSQFAILDAPPRSFVVQTIIYAYLVHKYFDISPDKVLPEIRCVNIADNAHKDWPLAWIPLEVEVLLDRFIDACRKTKARSLKELRRRKSLAKRVAFPFSSVRPTQQSIIESVDEAFEEGGDILIEAPPGSGKTLAVLTPALRVSLVNGCQLFYATAKSGGRNPVRKAVEQLMPYLKGLRVVFLSSQKEICEAAANNSVCQNCAFSLDTTTNDLPDHLAELDKGGIFDTGSFVALAKDNNFCAYSLAHKAAMQADLLVGDYNFIFDPVVRLEPFRRNEPVNWYLAGDEAHNLPDRSRENWSSQLLPVELDRLWSLVRDDLWRFNDLPAADELRQSYQSLKAWMLAQLELGESGASVEVEFSSREVQDLYEKLSSNAGRLLAGAGERIDLDARNALYGLLNAVGSFSRVVGFERGRYVHFIEADTQLIGVKCLDASCEIGEVINLLRGFVLFSGTFGPIEQFRREIGDPKRPYATFQEGLEHSDENRQLVLRIPSIDTRKRSRTHTAVKVARVIEKFSALSPGAILVVFPSYEYLDKISTILESTKFTVLQQRPDMTLAERWNFKQSMGKSSCRTIGLVVAGGQFSEAEDYPGEACVGVVIVGPCLPPTDPWKEALATYWYDRGEDGGAIAFLVPAIRRVVQAAGRMLRHDSDRGIVLLIDDRFSRNPIFSLLPETWQTMIESQHGNWEAAAREFWSSERGTG